MIASMVLLPGLLSFIFNSKMQDTTAIVTKGYLYILVEKF